MSDSNFGIWLLNEGLSEEINALTRRTIRMDLDNLVVDEDSDTNQFEWSRLLLAGSILARSEIRTHQEAALRIATGAITLGTKQSIRDAGAILFSKLSNSRAIELAQKRTLLSPGLDSRLGMVLRMELERRRFDNAILVESSGKWLEVNTFQQRFWNGASRYTWLSASAPTASGKTFLVLQWLIDHMRSSTSRFAVYLAPTRALVSEIESELLTLLGKQLDIEISSLPLRAKFETAITGGKKLILVFTQERLHLLANALHGEAIIDLLIVDEAHKIGDTQRGVILQEAIERMQRLNSQIKVVFISPATQNPEALLSDAPSQEQAATVDSDCPTVLQNLIVAEQAPRKPKKWNLSVRNNNGYLPVGVLELASTPGSIMKKLAFIASAIGQRGGTLVYANRAGDAEDIADLISQLMPQSSVDRELLDLADLARKGVHPKFTLASLVEKGVAFHYGNMPSLIRLEIERLFRTGKISFLVCTSTLIEGVNLSCRTIIVRGPRKGAGNPMEPHDFWNLAGRAGRWGNEFQGNIVCIDPGDSNAWPSGIPNRSRYPIKRESDSVLEKGGMLTYIETRSNTPIEEIPDFEKFEQVSAYLLSTFIRMGSIAHSNIARRHDAAMIRQLDEALQNVAQKIEITSEIIDRHPGVSALALQNLLNAFRAYEGDVENLLPAPVASHDSYDRFITIMRRINRYLYPAFMPDGLIPLHAIIIVQWLKGYSLASMIRKNIEYHEENNKRYSLPVLIRHTMDLVEQTARFRAPKYFSAYIDILYKHLRDIGRSDLIEGGLDIGTQLEFGVSTETLMSLMELGLSRMTAVVLYEKMARDDLGRDDCLKWVLERREKLESLDMPSIIIREVKEKLFDKLDEATTSPI